MSNNDYYDWYIRNFVFERSDQVVQRIVKRYKRQGAGNVSDGAIRHVLYRISEEHGRWGREIEGAMPPPTQQPPEPDPNPPVMPPPDGDGMKWPWNKPTGSYLYAEEGSDEFWLGSNRANQWQMPKIDRWLATPEQAAGTHVVYTCSTGERSEMRETTFYALLNDANERATVERLKRILANGKQPLVYAMSQEFFKQYLERNFNKLLDVLTKTTALVAPYCKIVVPFRELSDIYGGRDMDKRNAIMLAIRKGSDDVCVAEHEGGLREIPVNDFRDVGGRTMSLCQSGFSTPTGGRGRPGDRVGEGGRSVDEAIRDGKAVYDGAAGHCRANGERMYRYRDSGHILEKHANVDFENSIPPVRVQRWGPARDWASAVNRSKIIDNYAGPYVESSMNAGVA